ncbi:hypothetical protein ACVGW6_10445, partial [Enterobacter intestinihominis]
HDNGEAEVAGGGFALPRLLNNLPQQVGPVSAPAPGVNAGSVVRSGGLTPAPYPKETGETQKKSNTLAVFFFLIDSLKPKKNKNTHNPTSIG